MSASGDLEFLREVFKDQRLHVGIGTVIELGLAKDNSVLRVLINLLPENRTVIAEMTFADTSCVTFPEIDDLAIVVMIDGNSDEAFVIKLVNTSDEPIPLFATTGTTVIYSRKGKRVYIGSDTKIGIGRQNFEPIEPLVLGETLKNGLNALVNAFLNANPVVQTPMGPGFLDVGIRTALTNFQTTYLTNASTNILSQIGFTERGV